MSSALISLFFFVFRWMLQKSMRSSSYRVQKYIEPWSAFREKDIPELEHHEEWKLYSVDTKLLFQTFLFRLTITKFNQCSKSSYEGDADVENHTFWDVTLCSLVKVKRRFGWTNCLHLQRRGVIQARNHNEAGKKVDFHRTARIYIPEDTILHSQPQAQLNKHMI
jgi:hypothetical protein